MTYNVFSGTLDPTHLTSLCCQCTGVSGRSQPRQTSEGARSVEPASTAADDDDDDDDDDEVDDDDPFDIPEESDDFSALTVTDSPDRKPDGAEKQTAELELESMSRKDAQSRERHAGSVDGQSPTASRTDSGRRKVSSRPVML